LKRRDAGGNSQGARLTESQGVPADMNDYNVIYPAVVPSTDVKFDERLEAAVKRAIKPLTKEIYFQKRRRYDFWSRSNCSAIRSQEENLKWKTAVANYYKDDKIKTIQCMVTGHNVQDEVRASHIWKWSSGGKGLTMFNLEEKDVESERNGLLLVTGLERAFDTKRICFVYNPFDQKFYVYILDPALIQQPVALKVAPDDTVTKVLPGLTYGQLHLHFHLYMPEKKPFRRLLYFHAKCCFDYAKEMGWKVDRQQWKIYRELSQGSSAFSADEEDTDDDGAASSASVER